MITRIGVAPRKPGLDTATFQAHWAGPHGDVVTRLPGLRRYWQNHAVLDGAGEAVLPWPGFDACSDLEFDDVAAMHAAFQSEAYATAVKADEGDFVDKSRGGVIVGHRDGPDTPPADARVRLMVFMRRASGANARAFETAVTDLPIPSVAIEREVLVALPSEAVGASPIYDAVEMLWMRDAAEARHFVTSSEARLRLAPAAALVRGFAHHLAEVRVII
jgi:uncharacterized protein (TIGR02118 family)